MKHSIRHVVINLIIIVVFNRAFCSVYVVMVGSFVSKLRNCKHINQK